jgi:hypothetical protein
VHDFVDLIHDQADRPGFTWVQRCVQYTDDVAIAQSPLVGNVEAGKTNAFSELFPEIAFAIG